MPTHFDPISQINLFSTPCLFALSPTDTLLVLKRSLSTEFFCQTLTSQLTQAFNLETGAWGDS